MRCAEPSEVGAPLSFDYPLENMQMINANQGYEEVLVLVDAEFSVIVVMDSKWRDEAAPAYLIKQENGLSQRVGSCVVGIDEAWTMRIATVYNICEECREFAFLGDFDSRAAAIVHMWQRRREVILLPQ